MIDVITVGETMVAFIPEEKEKIRYAHSFGKRVAGAESNVAVGLAKLGRKSGWISKIGNDEFGEFILRELQGEGVDTSRVIKTDRYPTGLMFKETSFLNDTSVFYYRRNSAASTLSVSDLDEEYIRQAKILHLTGITPALSDSCREAFEYLAAFAKENGILLSFDPNIRLKLWSEKEATQCLLGILKQSDIVLINRREAEILTGLRETEAIIDRLRSFGAQKIAVKLGPEGAVVADRQNICRCPQTDVPVVDNIGGGDAFNAGFLCGVLEGQDIETCGRMGSMMGSLAVASVGDTEGLPNRKQLSGYLNHERIIYR